MEFTETNTLKNTSFLIKKVDKNSSFEDMLRKIKDLRRMPFHSVFVTFPIMFYDQIYSVLEKADIKVVGFVQNKDNTISMKVS